MNAYLPGLLQIVMVMAVEILNLFTILTSNSISEVVKDSCAYIGIAYVDDIFFERVVKAINKEVLESKDYDCLWMIKRTTSKNAMQKIDAHRLDDSTYMAVDKK